MRRPEKIDHYHAGHHKRLRRSSQVRKNYWCLINNSRRCCFPAVQFAEVSDLKIESKTPFFTEKTERFSYSGIQQPMMKNWWSDSEYLAWTPRRIRISYSKLVLSFARELYAASKWYAAAIVRGLDEMRNRTKNFSRTIDWRIARHIRVCFVSVLFCFPWREVDVQKECVPFNLWDLFRSIPNRYYWGNFFSEMWISLQLLLYAFQLDAVLHKVSGCKSVTLVTFARNVCVPQWRSQQLSETFEVNKNTNKVDDCDSDLVCSLDDILTTIYSLVNSSKKYAMLAVIIE